MVQGLIDICIGLLEWLIGLIPQVTFFDWFASAVSSIYGVLYEASVIIPFSDESSDTATDGYDFIDETEDKAEGEPHVFEETAEKSTSTTQQVIVNGNVFNAKNQFFGNVENVFDS